MIFPDEMRPHFEPLLSDFHQIGSAGILVAGGYGLFLKQNWLLSQPDRPVIVPVNQWYDNAPRVTKDLDLVVGLDLIAGEGTQKEMLKVLRQNGFEVCPRNPRWKFIKALSETRSLIVELHAQVPDETMTGVQADKFRIKHKPSLGDDGVHARTNPEAVGSALHPFTFDVQGMTVQVPNPITWLIMKLTAAEERWQKSQSPQHDEDTRAFSRVQALKHAQDACRVVAMVTREENDLVPEVIAKLQGTVEFKKASAIVRESFISADRWAAQGVSEKWSPESFALIRDTLGRWFGPVT